MVSVTFGAIVLVFVVYDILVQRRNTKLINSAAQSNAIVSSMFPSQIRDRLIGVNAGSSGTKSLKSYMKAPNSSKIESSSVDDSKPLADLFLATTVLFADIVGFTAWSSTREPPQVFKLLETIYSSFDKVAEQRRVFKVETVGDCYVAATVSLLCHVMFWNSDNHVHSNCNYATFSCFSTSRVFQMLVMIMLC